ncbi:hypothetical protein BDV93DRAFT_607555 [Ceratobasidium sp. AG-I]|nr:hypothetical protein BDV93DRAFT_607555 [Ceratobasidium sp. AG-I]
MDAASLSKLKVSQLKEKCKELKVVGYSKLAKPALIEKLLASVVGGSGSGAFESRNDPESLTRAYIQTRVAPTHEALAEQVQEALPIDKILRESASDIPHASSSSAQATANEKKKVTKKRPRKNEEDGTLAKKAKKTTATRSEVPKSKSKTTSIPKPRPTGLIVAPKSYQPRTQDASTTNASVDPTSDPSPASKTNSNRAPPTYQPKTFKMPTTTHPPRLRAPSKPTPSVASNNAPNTPRALTNQYLDFPPSPFCDDFPRISMPPSMARRRQAENMSVVFSGISDASVLALCVRVSRAWRYGVYLSATHTLVRDFPGQRLDEVRARIKEPRMTSMWAYLRARRAEATSRRETFDRSWLGQFYSTHTKGCSEILPLKHHPISQQIWTSPDDDRQITVALRFVSTRLVFALARRCDAFPVAREWSDTVVIGADEVVPNEIWRITIGQGFDLRERRPDESKRADIESFYVLFETGEVIGHAPPPPVRRTGNMVGQRIAKGRPHLEVFDNQNSEEMLLRTDWAQYVNACERGDAPCLQDSITSADRESYVAGISAFWLRSLHSKLGKENDLLETIARRYVLSCVEPNSVSGTYKTVTDMACELAGGGTTAQSLLGRKQHVGLLVSEHHLVESVHLAAKSSETNTALHPALALVLTAPGREYFVLRDTGMPIGTSDEGLEPIWQQILECDAWGNTRV